jgi:hypothetical protein
VERVSVVLPNPVTEENFVKRVAVKPVKKMMPVVAAISANRVYVKSRIVGSMRIVLANFVNKGVVWLAQKMHPVVREKSVRPEHVAKVVAKKPIVRAILCVMCRLQRARNVYKRRIVLVEKSVKKTSVWFVRRIRNVEQVSYV